MLSQRIKFSVTLTW